MIALRSFATHRAALDPTKLLDIAVIALNRPNLARRGTSLVDRHQFIARGPIFRVTVWGVDPKEQDEAIAFEVNARASATDRTLAKWPIAASVRIDQSIVLQLCQPVP